MNRLMIKSAFAVAALAGFGAWAQDMGAAPVASEAVAPVASEAVAPRASEAEAPAAVPLTLATPNDQGPAIVAENQKHAPAVAAPKGMDANGAVQKALNDRGFSQTYDAERGSIIQVAFAADNLEDPASGDFMIKRELLVRQAELAAKVQIASIVRRQMNGSVRVNTPGTAERKVFMDKFADQIAASEQLRAKVNDLLRQLEQSEATMLTGVTLEDQWKRLMDGVIKKLDAKYNKEDIAAEKQQQYLKIKAAYEQAKAQLDDLEQKKNAMFPKKTIETEATSFAEFRLCGAVNLVQSESWDGKQFQVAVAVVWSPKLQERALVTLGCGQPVGGKPGAESLDAWLGRQVENGEMAKLVGTRQFIDDKGRQYVLGFSASEVPDDATDYEDAVAQADLLAQQAVVFHLFSEGEGSSKVKAEMARFKGRASDVAANVSGNMYQAIPKDFTVSGLGKVYSAKCRNVLSGKDIYVSVAAVDSVLAGRSSEILRGWYAGAAQAIATSQFMQGEQKGMSDAYEHVKKSPEAGARGRAQGQQAIVDALAPQAPAPEAAPVAPAVSPVPAPPAKTSPRKGTYTTGSLTDDF